MLQGYWDIHNHILPGVDDGASCKEETLALVKLSRRQGIRHMVFTPHYRKGMFEVPLQEKARVFLDTVPELRQLYPDMKFYLGCEYYVSSQDNCDTAHSWCAVGTKTLLIEFSPQQSLRKMTDTVEVLLRQGITPILAHVERYQALREHPERITQLQDLGAWIQINGDSLIGKNGFGTGRWCKQLLKAGGVDLIASDAHSDPLRVEAMGKSVEYVTKTLGEAAAKRIFIENPQQLFGC